MKKILAMILAVILVLSMAACASGGHDIIQDMPTNASTTESNQKLSRGTVSGNVYSSDYSGLTFRAPQGWTYATDTQIAETMNIGMEILGDELAFNETATKMATVYDTMIYGQDGSNINIIYENLALTNALSYNETDYLNAVKSQLGMLTEPKYIVSDEITTVQLCGQTYYVMPSVTSYNGVDMVQNYYVRRIGNYMNAVIITCVGDTTHTMMEACFG